MNIKQLNKSKVPIVIIDNSLEKFVNIPIFQEKVDKANEILRTVGLPKKLATKKG
ncbi:MAG: hypothetical protein WCO28_11125 [Bacteroidota bacterium]